MEDKNMTCKDCGVTFTFTVGEQQFYAEKGFTNEPTRCLECRKARKSTMRKPSGSFNRSRSNGW